MSILKILLLLLIPISLLIFLHRSFSNTKTCNQSLCKKQITKCFVPETCLCLNLHKNTSCFENCLQEHAEECSPCLSEFLPKFCTIAQLADDHHHHHRQSVVEIFKKTIPGLFEAITKNPDKLNRWEVVRMVARVEDGPEKKKRKAISFRCSVVFLNECTSRITCRKNCLTMGARSYRWFHNGCCECVGEKCVYHGVGESLCKRCSPDMMEEITHEEEKNDIL